MILNIKKVRSKFIEAKEKALETNTPILFSITDDTKIDLLSGDHLKPMKVSDDIPIIGISSITGDHLNQAVQRIAEMIQSLSQNINH